MIVIWPWLAVGRFEDGAEIKCGGHDEIDAYEKLFEISESGKHGGLEWYSGYTDYIDGYQDGEYIGGSRR